MSKRSGFLSPENQAPSVTIPFNREASDTGVVALQIIAKPDNSFATLVKIMGPDIHTPEQSLFLYSGIRLPFVQKWQTPHWLSFAFNSDDISPSEIISKLQDSNKLSPAQAEDARVAFEQFKREQAAKPAP